MDLISAMELGPREHVAIVGAGGKTTLMFSLAHELRLAGYRVLTSTTTKIWRQEAGRAPCTVAWSSNLQVAEEAAEGLETRGHVFVARAFLPSGKAAGIEPSVADFLFDRLNMDYLILEADGAAGRPLKIPGENEPVVPSSATLVVAMMGLDALGKPLGPDVVFRMDRFREVSGLRPGESLESAAIARVFTGPEGLFKGSPKRARKIVFLNKLDLLPRRQDSTDLAGLILGPADAPATRVIIGSIREGTYLSLRRGE